VQCGSEPGVVLADKLSTALSLRGNGTDQSAVRINKYLQSKAARHVGLATAAQQLASSIEDVHAFLSSHAEVLRLSGEFKAVVKPVDGAGSEGVTVCASPEEVGQCAELQ
jgi:biotin carboxylase